MEPGGHPAGAEEHDGKPRQTQGEEDPDGRAEKLALLVLPAPGLGLGHQLGKRQGQARRGDGEEDVVNLIGGVEVGFALLAQDVVQGDLIKEADAFDNGHRGGQNGRAAQEGLFFLRRHGKFTSNTLKNARTPSVREGPIVHLMGPGPSLDQIPSRRRGLRCQFFRGAPGSPSPGR